MNRLFYVIFLMSFLLTSMSCSEDNSDGYHTSSEDQTQKTVLVSNISVTKSVEMYVGETKTLSATVTPSNATKKDVTWSSSNTSVASVSSSGVVTANAAGNATITVKANDGSNVTASCTVTVTQNKVLVTELSLSRTKAEMFVDETLTLSVTAYPSNATNKDVTWSSSNTNVATVSSSGVVTAKSAGNATITAKANDGSGITASCTITVTQKTVLVTKVSLSKTKVEMSVGETLTLTAEVLPSNATNKNLSWSSSNANVVSVDNNGSVTAKAAGQATITVKADGGDNVIDQCTIVVKKDDSIGIDDYDSDKNWN